MTNGIVWQRSPRDIAKELEVWGVRMQIAVKTLAAYFAQKLQDEARQNAPWEDRTGNARSGLMGFSEDLARDFVLIYLTHSMFYGKYLEYSNGGKYAIIMPTIERNLPEIERQLKRLLA
jgi:hypothetical protein